MLTHVSLGKLRNIIFLTIIIPTKPTFCHRLVCKNIIMTMTMTVTITIIVTVTMAMTLKITMTMAMTMMMTMKNTLFNTIAVLCKVTILMYIMWQT